ncbi:HAT family dimerization domain containing protein, partial [Trifolium medium]|nr:HAT family dimerization domain containing protein [Trifolium medium]
CLLRVGERNWSAFKMVHTKRRNRLKQTMNDVVFVMVNSRLAKKKKGRTPVTPDVEFDDLGSDDDWVIDEDVDRH